MDARKDLEQYPGAMGPSPRTALLAACVALACDGSRLPDGDTLVARGSVWRWSNDIGTSGSRWAQLDADDSGWAQGRAPLGYGADALATEVERAPDEDRLAVWFRHAFSVDDAGAVQGLGLEIRRDDGAQVFLNGREVMRSNLPGGAVTAESRAPLAVGRDQEERYVRFGLPGELVRSGRNVLAVAVHQVRPESGDLAFDLSLLAYTSRSPLAVLRGPYLQSVSEDMATVRWTTNRPVRGRVRFGTRPGGLDAQILAEHAQLDHELVLSGLPAGRRVYYAVGSPDADLAGGDDHHFFRTAPARGDRAATRLWVTGDQGSGNDHARAVRDAFLDWADERGADAWLTLGDNAYPSGTPSDFQERFFDFFQPVLRTAPIWPAVGNHDFNALDPLNGGTAFLRLFSLPMGGEAGGAPSGSEQYYAFDLGNLHVVVLDSDKSPRSPTGPMLRWLREDLAHHASRDDSDWLVAALHHPPFSRGTHYDDQVIQGREMRAHAIPILEAAGVDLVLAGHDHVYERSFLMHGPHPGTWPTDAGRVISRTRGRRDEDGPYRKGGSAREGVVYAVVGSSGQTGPGSLDHPSMAVSLSVHGSLVIDVDGCSLDATFIDEDGEVRDRFALEKGAPCRSADTP